MFKSVKYLVFLLLLVSFVSKLEADTPDVQRFLSEPDGKGRWFVYKNHKADRNHDPEKIFAENGVHYLIYKKYIVRVEDAKECAAENIDVYINDIKMPAEGQFAAELSKKKPIFSIHEDMGTWFDGMYGDKIFFDLGTGPERGYAIIDVITGKLHVSFSLIGSPRIIKDHLLAVVKDPKVDPKLLKNAPFKRTISKKKEQELRTQLSVRIGFVADIDVDLIKNTVTYKNIRKDVIIEQ